MKVTQGCQIKADNDSALTAILQFLLLWVCVLTHVCSPAKRTVHKTTGKQTFSEPLPPSWKLFVLTLCLLQCKPLSFCRLHCMRRVHLLGSELSKLHWVSQPICTFVCCMFYWIGSQGPGVPTSISLEETIRMVKGWQFILNVTNKRNIKIKYVLVVSTTKT